VAFRRCSTTCFSFVFPGNNYASEKTGSHASTIGTSLAYEFDACVFSGDLPLPCSNQSEAMSQTNDVNFSCEHLLYLTLYVSCAGGV